MRIPAARTAARFGEAAALVKNKTARNTLIGNFHKFFPLGADRPFNMTQMVHNLFFRDGYSLGNIPQGHLVTAQQIYDLPPYGLPVVKRLHVSLALLYSRTYEQPSSPETLKYLLPGVSQRFSIDMISIFRLPA